MDKRRQKLLVLSKTQEEIYPKDDNCSLFRAVVKGKRHTQFEPFDMSLFDKIKKEDKR